MYSDFINMNVTVLVATRGDIVFEYSGVMVSETENEIVLENVNIGQALASIQKSVFGGSISQYKSNLKKAIINKDYIISCQ